MPSVTLALDWTPNTNHTGFFVAQSHGYYDDAGVDVSFLSPATDDYETTPAKRVARGEATLAIAPSESVLSCAKQAQNLALQGGDVAPCAFLWCYTTDIDTTPTGWIFYDPAGSVSS